MKRPRHQQLIASCLVGTQSRAYIKRVTDSENFLRAVSKEFEVHAYYQLAYLFREPTAHRNSDRYCNVSHADLITLYEQKLVKNASGRKLYQKIKNTAPDGFCQLCHAGLAETLDHYLPKEQFPSLSIAPFNLIPACLRCNKEKHTKVPSSVKEQSLHPLYDKHVYRMDWIEVAITPDTGRVSYSAGHTLDDTTHARVQTHLTDHNIGQLYSTHATIEVAQLARTLCEGPFPLSPNDAHEEVRERYGRLGRWRRDGYLTVKAWEVALLRCLLRADWFWQGGYAQIWSSYQNQQNEDLFSDRDGTIDVVSSL